jgi:hypothetical protein
MGKTLPENRYERKRYAVNQDFRQIAVVRKPGKKREIRSPLQAVFLKRVQEEMANQRINPNQLSKRVGAPRQTTINDVMLGADPRLETVHGIAIALGVPAVSLLTESRTAVHQLPGYPQIGGAPAHNGVRDRKKTRG